MINKTNLDEHSGIRQRTHERVDKIMDKTESMNERAIQMRENVDEYIRENPEKSVLIAAGIGILTGAVLTAVIMKKRR